MGETQLGMLQRAQNKTVRVILHYDKYTKIEHVLQFMSVKQTLHCTVCIFIYKILNDVLPLRNKIEIVGSENQRHTRQAGNIALEFRKTRNVQKSVFYEGAKLYNSLPFGIRECDGLKIFKRELKDYILNTICLVLHFFAFCILFFLCFIFYSVIFCCFSHLLCSILENS